MKLHHSLSVPCPGVDHLDFTADGRYLLASCEFGAQLIAVDVQKEKVIGSNGAEERCDATGREALPRRAGLLCRGHDGQRRLVGRRPPASSESGSSPPALARTAFTRAAIPSTSTFPTEARPRSRWSPSQLARSSRSGASPAAAALTWEACPQTATSSGSRAATTRRSTRSAPGRGSCSARIPVGSGPHGLSLYPQPGRYSLGHTGVFR